MKIIIKDNFLPDFRESREIAINTPRENAEDSSNYIFNDLVSDTPRDTRLMQNQFSEWLGEPVYLVYNDYRKYNVCMKDPEGYHIHHDDVDYIGLVYLNDSYTSEDGTQLLRHKETGIDFVDKDVFGSQNISEAPYGSTRNIDEWEPYLKIQAKPNRLVIFEPQYYHSEMRTFGSSFEEARVVEIFHIIKKHKLKHWAKVYGIPVEDIRIYDTTRDNFFI